jgi:hypothetical protein
MVDGPMRVIRWSNGGVELEVMNGCVRVGGCKDFRAESSSLHRCYGKTSSTA